MGGMEFWPNDWNNGRDPSCLYYPTILRYLPVTTHDYQLFPIEFITSRTMFILHITTASASTAMFVPITTFLSFSLSSYGFEIIYLQLHSSNRHWCRSYRTNRYNVASANFRPQSVPAAI
jgi:hypothetical protein